MSAIRNHFVTSREREALISLTALGFIEEHGLLPAAQLDDAKRSLQALFLRASGEESTLRRLIEVLKATRQIHNSFASISGTLAGVRKCVTVVEEKIAGLRSELERRPVSAEANAAFVGPFLSFSLEFAERIALFAESLRQYLAAREQEARAESLYRITVEARERLRRRLAGRLAEARDEVETRIKDEIVASFDYREAATGLDRARYEARSAAESVRDGLSEIHAMCQRAMDPALRDRLARIDPETDIFARFAAALAEHPDIAPLEELALELFKLYQHAHGMFRLDFQKLDSALDSLLNDTEAYFQAKEEDRDIAAKRAKLQKIEGLIPFLERAAALAEDDRMDAYPRFSRELSAAISERRAPWQHIAEDLLRAKIQAEADISSRL